MLLQLHSFFVELVCSPRYHSKLDQLPKGCLEQNLWRFLLQDFLQAGYPSRQPTNSVKGVR